MISRIERARISGFDQKDFDQYRLVRGTITGYRDDGKQREDLEQSLNEENSLQLEGKVWRLTYQTPKNRSTLETFRSYQTELTKAGFKVLISAPIRNAPVPCLKELPLRLIEVLT